MRDQHLHQQLTHKIIGAAIAVHKYFGPGFLEKVYELALEKELNKKGLKVVCQRNIDIFYHDEFLCQYVIDLLVEDRVIVELKAISNVTDIHRAQVINYLKASGYEVGLLLNFGQEKLDKHRFVNERDYVKRKD